MKNGMVPVLHVHVRLQLPRLTGALRTPWVNVLSAQFNDTPVPLWSTNSKEVRAYALPSTDGQVRILMMYFTKLGSNNNTEHGHGGGAGGGSVKKEPKLFAIQCYHTREVVFSSTEVRVYVLCLILLARKIVKMSG